MSALRTLALIAMVIVGLNAVETHRSLTNAQVKRIESLKNGKSWGSLLVNLAEMHMLAQGPIEDLVAAIESVVVDLEAKQQRADADFEKRTQEHNTEVRQLTDLINEAQRNIADTQALIENVLVPQRDQLTEEIDNLEREIESIKVYIEETTAARKAANAAWQERVTEHTEAIAAIHEALGLLDQLNGETSLVQLKKLHHSVEKVAKHLQGKRFVESTFAKSLVALMNTEFTNSDQLEAVKNLLGKILSNLETSLQQENDDEAKANSEFEEDIKNQYAHIQQNTASINEKREALARTEEQIAQANDYIEERTADLAGYNADLEAENAAYEEATNTYNDLSAQLTSEHDACSEALSVIQNATIEDYIGQRIAQTSEHVIGTNHGSGVEVAGGRFQWN